MRVVEGIGVKGEGTGRGGKPGLLIQVGDFVLSVIGAVCCHPSFGESNPCFGEFGGKQKERCRK